MSCYNLDEADVAEQRKRFNLYEAEVSCKTEGRTSRQRRSWALTMSQHYIPALGPAWVGTSSDSVRRISAWRLAVSSS